MHPGPNEFDKSCTPNKTSHVASWCCCDTKKYLWLDAGKGFGQKNAQAIRLPLFPRDPFPGRVVFYGLACEYCSKQSPHRNKRKTFGNLSLFGKVLVLAKLKLNGLALPNAPCTSLQEASYWIYVRYSLVVVQPICDQWCLNSGIFGFIYMFILGSVCKRFFFEFWILFSLSSWNVWCIMLLQDFLGNGNALL